MKRTRRNHEETLKVHVALAAGDRDKTLAELEEVYLHAHDAVSTAYPGLERYLLFYNQTRPHQALDGQTPDQVYDDHLTTRQTAA